MNMMDMLNAEVYVLISLNDNHVCMFYVYAFFLQFICMYMFMGLVSRMFGV